MDYDTVPKIFRAMSTRLHDSGTVALQKDYEQRCAAYKSIANQCTEIKEIYQEFFMDANSKLSTYTNFEFLPDEIPFNPGISAIAVQRVMTLFYNFANSLGLQADLLSTLSEEISSLLEIRQQMKDAADLFVEDFRTKSTAVIGETVRARESINTAVFELEELHKLAEAKSKITRQIKKIFAEKWNQLTNAIDESRYLTVKGTRHAIDLRGALADRTHNIFETERMTQGQACTALANASAGFSITAADFGGVASASTLGTCEDAASELAEFFQESAIAVSDFAAPAFVPFRFQNRLMAPDPVPVPRPLAVVPVGIAVALSGCGPFAEGARLYILATDARNAAVTDAALGRPAIVPRTALTAVGKHFGFSRALKAFVADTGDTFETVDGRIFGQKEAGTVISL